MKPILYGLKAIRYKGKLHPFGFTDDEIAEIIEDENQEIRAAESCIDDWYKDKPAPLELGQQLIKDGAVSQDVADEFRRKYLWDKFTAACVDFYETPKELRVKRQWARKERTKMEYEIFTYRPEDDTRIPQQDIDYARSINIRGFIKVNKASFAPCPFHKEKDPSFHIHNNMYYCFGCGAKGDVISLVMKTRNLDFRQAVSLLTGKTYGNKEENNKG